MATPKEDVQSKKDGRVIKEETLKELQAAYWTSLKGAIVKPLASAAPKEGTAKSKKTDNAGLIKSIKKKLEELFTIPHIARLLQETDPNDSNKTLVQYVIETSSLDPIVKIEIVKFLLEKKALVDSIDAKGSTALIAAIRQKSVPMVQLLVDHVLIMKSQAAKETIKHDAGDTKEHKEHKERKEREDTQSDKITAVETALEVDLPDAIPLLLELVEDPRLFLELLYKPGMVYKKDEDHRRDRFAIRFPSLLKAILNHEYDRHETPLADALRRNRPDVFCILLEHGQSIFQKFHKGSEKPICILDEIIERNDENLLEEITTSYYLETILQHARKVWVHELNTIQDFYEPVLKRAFQLKKYNGLYRIFQHIFFGGIDSVIQDKQLEFHRLHEELVEKDFNDSASELAKKLRVIIKNDKDMPLLLKPYTKDSTNGEEICKKLLEKLGIDDPRQLNKLERWEEAMIVRAILEAKQYNYLLLLDEFSNLAKHFKAYIAEKVLTTNPGKIEQKTKKEKRALYGDDSVGTPTLISAEAVAAKRVEQNENDVDLAQHFSLVSSAKFREFFEQRSYLNYFLSKWQCSKEYKEYREQRQKETEALERALGGIAREDGKEKMLFQYNRTVSDGSSMLPLASLPSPGSEPAARPRVSSVDNLLDAPAPSKTSALAFAPSSAARPDA